MGIYKVNSFSRQSWKKNKMDHNALETLLRYEGRVSGRWLMDRRSKSAMLVMQEEAGFRKKL